MTMFCFLSFATLFNMDNESNIRENSTNTDTSSNCVDESKKVPITAKEKLLSWLNGSLKIKMTDGRVIIGNFFCTDRDSNVILGSSSEYIREEDVGVELPRMLGLVMVPGRHIVTIHYSSDSLLL